MRNMSLNYLTYGKQLESSFLHAGETIARHVENGSFSLLSKKLNNVFFGGGVFAPKSFASLASIKIPEAPICIIGDLDGHDYINIRKQISFSAVMGFLESIPLIGSAIAAINAIYHLFGMLSSYSTLKVAVKKLSDIERNENNISDKQYFGSTRKVFEAAIDYTVHQNHLVGSLLSLIPLVKPVIRIAQGTIFNFQANNSTLPQAQ